MTPTGPRQPGEPELMSASDAARALGVRQTNLRQLHGFPEPYDHVASGALYRADEIRALRDARAAAKVPAQALPASAAQK